MGYYLVNIGPNPENDGGVGSRGYWIRRSGYVVRKSWGAIDVDGVRGGQFYCRDGRRDQVDNFRSPAEADAFVQQKLREKLVYADGGYRRLPPPNKIW